MSLPVQLVARLTDVTGRPVHAVLLPAEPDLPAVVYQRVSTVPVGSHEPGRAPLTESRWQIACWADTYADVIALTDQVHDALDGWSDKTAARRIDRTAVVMDLDAYDPDSLRHRRLIDVAIWADERPSQ